MRYHLGLSCLTLTEDCVTGTITDVLDENLEFVEVVKPTGITSSASYDDATRTVTIEVGSEADPLQGGPQMEFVLVARVKSQPSDTDGDGYGVIPNTATATTPGRNRSLASRLIFGSLHLRRTGESEKAALAASALAKMPLTVSN